MKLRSFRFIWNLWPPFLGLGISVRNVAQDNKSITMVLKKRPWNKNYFGTQYGGGIFAMTDGVHALLLYNNLPKKYHIWDKSAKIDYLKRGLSNLTAEFTITEQELKGIEAMVDTHEVLDWQGIVEIKDVENQIVARVERIVSIKLKAKYRRK